MRITDEGLRNSSARWIPSDCVIVAISGATAGRSAVNKIPLTTNQHCCNFEIDPAQAHYRYVFYWVRNEYEQIRALGRGARSDLSASIIKGVRIPMPPLEDQARIVDILDKFDALVNDLSIGLPAELAARRKQYEHYRDRLLTFKEAVA
jgi:type I restriction enzyme S subunit